jgi:flagellar motor protein MotB
VENEEAIIEKLKEELRAKTLKLEATKAGFEMKLNERNIFQDKAATIQNQCEGIIKDLEKGIKKETFETISARK